MTSDRFNFTDFVIDFTDYDRGNPIDHDYDPEIPEQAQSGPPWTPRDPWEFERLVENRVTFRMADEVAQQRIQDIKQGFREMPANVTIGLSELLLKDLPDQLFTIQDLWPRHGNVLFAAEAKTGKSTTIANLIRVLCDGGDFLNYEHFRVVQVPAGKTIALLDLEMNERRIRDELQVQHIRHPEKLLVSVLRGRSQTFDFTNDDQRNEWIQYLKNNNVHTLIIDPIAPLLAQLGVDENDNFGVTKLFNLLDKVKTEAGITDMMVVHHTGHSAEGRPRGASRFKDWPDAVWMLRKESDAPGAERHLKAYGRDVSLDWGLVRMDTNKRLSFEEQDAAERPTAIHNDQDLIETFVLESGEMGATITGAIESRATGNLRLPDLPSRETWRTRFAGTPRIHGHGRQGQEIRYYHEDVSCPHPECSIGNTP